MSTENENNFYYNGVTIPFYRICGFREDYNEDFSNDENERSNYPDLKQGEKLLNITIKLTDGEYAVSFGEGNPQFPMPENLYRTQMDKYNKWLEKHEKELVKNGNGAFLKMSSEQITKTINEITEKSAKTIKETFEEQSSKMDSFIENLQAKEEKLNRSIEETENLRKKLAESQNQIMDLLSAFQDNLTGFDLLKAEEELKEKDSKISKLTGQDNVSKIEDQHTSPSRNI